MKALFITSILIRLMFFCLLIFQFYIKNHLISIQELYIDYAMFAFGLIAFWFPKKIWMYIAQIAHCGYLIYTAIEIKHKEMSDIKEDDAKDLFVAFFFFFSALFQEGVFHTDLFYRIIQQFQFFLLNIVNIILLALALFIVCIYDAISTGKIEMYPSTNSNAKQSGSTQQSISPDVTKEKVD